jgi:hypothetical protein
MPACLESIFELAEGTIMGLESRELPIYGMQIHLDLSHRNTAAHLLKNVFISH